MVIKKVRFKNKAEVEDCTKTWSVSLAIARELKEYRRLWDEYLFRDQINGA